MENEQILITMLLFLLCGSVWFTFFILSQFGRMLSAIESESFKVGPEFHKFMEEFCS